MYVNKNLNISPIIASAYIIILVLLLIFSSVESKYPRIAYITYEPICMFKA